MGNRVTETCPFDLATASHWVFLYQGNKRYFEALPQPIAARVNEVIQAQIEKKLPEGPELCHFDNYPEVLIVPLPQKKGLDENDRIRLVASQALQVLKGRALKSLVWPLQGGNEKEFASLVDGLGISAYRFDNYKSDKKQDKKNPANPEEIIFLRNGTSHASDTQLLTDFASLSECLSICRDLVNIPGSDLTPQKFAERAITLAKSNGLKITVREDKQLSKEGFTGLLTVGKGSSHPPCLVTLRYDGRDKKDTKENKADHNKHLVLVGKGVTFDTGGISIKPSAAMWEMKCDMAGAAAALSALCAIAKLKLPLQVSAVLCLAENRPGNGSVLPGDIFTAKNGKTVMVDNTDAEGRLILTDGLWEAGAIEATHIIDLATLTGAIIRAIGPSIAGLFCANETFSQVIQESGKVCGEKFWPMPLEEEYREYLDDSVADMKNIGKAEAGAITAALFLQEFAPSNTQAWAHLDIAGPAFITSNWKYFTPGATGFPMRSLVEVARRLAKES